MTTLEAIKYVLDNSNRTTEWYEIHTLHAIEEIINYPDNVSICVNDIMNIFDKYDIN